MHSPCGSGWAAADLIHAEEFIRKDQLQKSLISTYEGMQIRLRIGHLAVPVQTCGPLDDVLDAHAARICPQLIIAEPRGLPTNTADAAGTSVLIALKSAVLSAPVTDGLMGPKSSREKRMP